MRNRMVPERHEKDQMMNDFVNTSLVAALLSGFALDNFQGAEGSDATTLERIQVICMYFAVHMTTFSAIAAALLYRVVNDLDEQAAHNFGARTVLLRQMPFYVFLAGGGLYIMGVVFNALSAAEADRSTTAKNILYVVYSVGGACCCIAVLFFLVYPERLAAQCYDDLHGVSLPEGGSRRRVQPSGEPDGAPDAAPPAAKADALSGPTREAVRDEMMAVLQMMSLEQTPPS